MVEIELLVIMFWFYKLGFWELVSVRLVLFRFNFSFRGGNRAEVNWWDMDWR